MGNLLLLLEWVQCCLEKDQMDLIVPKEAGNGNGSDSGEGEDRKPEKNFGELYQKKLAKLEELWDMPMNVDYQV